jgi:tyrosyl-DNA phosphodiesterase-1
MLILLRHDSTAQVIIHTANMIPFDWANMTQGLWKSPLLPLLADPSSSTTGSAQQGSGSKFKTDLINYLKAYDTRRTVCKSLTEQLLKYDFSEIHASLIASVPGKQCLADEHETLWGWPGLKNALRSVPVLDGKPEIVIQISSIATLGQSDQWLRETFFAALGAGKNQVSSNPKFRIIFPTAEEVRRSLNGYRSGSAIHTRIQTPAQAKQVQYLHPMLCHWAGDVASSATPSAPISDAGRKRAAPHIKTYIRFSDADKSSIDWMLVTSANLSKQAWGDTAKPAGDVRICSYEIGVLVWPELFGEKATMVPTFKSDMPPADTKKEDILIVGARMPYDLPLAPYAKDDVPWCASASYSEPDWAGAMWNVE